MKAYVFVYVAPRKSAGVVEQVRRLDGVKSADICWGLPDIIALLEAPDGPCKISSSTGFKALPV